MAQSNNRLHKGPFRLPMASTAPSKAHSVIPCLDTAVDPRSLPKSLVRVGRKGQVWELPRRFSRYGGVSQEQLSVRGAAPKFILRSHDDPNDWYIVKEAEKWGPVETLSELLNNMLGRELGFPMAHAGVLRADGVLCFASHNFQMPGETLIHGSLLLEETFGADLDGVGKKKWDEQRTYDLDLIVEMLRTRCGEAAEGIFFKLLEMIVFDALIGSMDRHLQNWGLLASVEEPRTYRFSPIFDSARALLWNCDEDKLKMLETQQGALDAYINRARPIMGCVSTGKAVNHFELVQHLAKKYPQPIGNALALVHPKPVGTATRILREFPFATGFTKARRRLITKVLVRRAEILHQTGQ